MHTQLHPLSPKAKYAVLSRRALYLYTHASETDPMGVIRLEGMCVRALKQDSSGFELRPLVARVEGAAREARMVRFAPDSNGTPKPTPSKQSAFAFAAESTAAAVEWLDALRKYTLDAPIHAALRTQHSGAWLPTRTLQRVMEAPAAADGAAAGDAMMDDAAAVCAAVVRAEGSLGGTAAVHVGTSARCRAIALLQGEAAHSAAAAISAARWRETLVAASLHPPPNAAAAERLLRDWEKLPPRRGGTELGAARGAAAVSTALTQCVDAWRVQLARAGATQLATQQAVHSNRQQLCRTAMLPRAPLQVGAAPNAVLLWQVAEALQRRSAELHEAHAHLATTTGQLERDIARLAAMRNSSQGVPTSQAAPTLAQLVSHDFSARIAELSETAAQRAGAHAAGAHEGKEGDAERAHLVLLGN